ncbi:IPO9 (predicted) [Pycnogonum litorale]
MAAPGVSCAEVSRSLKEALFETLSGILSPDHDIRVAAEERIKALEVTEEFGVHLAELTVDRNCSLAIRQLASVLLKQYVEIHWSQLSEKFQPPETTQNAKMSIRCLLPQCLNESISKVRSSTAYAISAIAHWDWPELWPELFPILMQLLVSAESDSVHGAMRVLTEFTQEVTDAQMPQVAVHILPEMYKVFMETEKYSIRTRGRAVAIFSTCASVIVYMSSYHVGAAKTLLYPILPQFTEALVLALQVPDGMTSDSGLKMEIIKALTLLVRNVPNKMLQWLPQVLPTVWNALTQSASMYPLNKMISRSN